MLERLVGAVERNETPQPSAAGPAHPAVVPPPVRRGHPCRSLTAVAAALLAFPGLIVDTLFALVGPLINLLDCSVPEAFRRSVRLVWPHFMIVFVMITLPLAIEHEVVVLIAELVPHEQICLVFLTNFVLGFVFGVALGLMEVSLAERLVSGAHGPGEPSTPRTSSYPAGRSRSEGTGGAVTI